MLFKIIKYTAIIVLLIAVHLYFYNSEYVKKVDYKIYDITNMSFNTIKEEKKSSYAVVVDIDEKSIQQLGQWPWPRVIDAKLIEIIHRLNPSAIGVNILFSEKDRTSPIMMHDFYEKFFGLKIHSNKFPSELRDNDKLLADTLKKSTATLATYFNNSDYIFPHCEKLFYRNNMFSSIQTEHMAPSLLCNHDTIQGDIENFGFINAWKDGDGKLRRVPLFINYKERVFPSFALATILSFDKDRKINTDENTVLIDTSRQTPKVLSAIDVLEGNFQKEEIQGKIVILGSSVVGLNPTYVTSDDRIISNSMIHALVADSILSDTLFTQPELYKKINFYLSFLFSILIILFFFKRYYLSIVALFFVALSISIVSLYYTYTDGFYISIGYFWTPFLYFFTFFLIYHFIEINREKQDQEKILIIQSKLASMGEMISLIAHQWRQPLSLINGVVINIDIDNRKKILDDETLDKHLNQIEDTTAYLSKTINDFTGFFSKNKKSEPFYIKDIVKQAEDLTVISSHKNIEITYNEKEEILVKGYSSELIQSLLVLLNNAIYACQKNLDNINKGKIRIDAYREKEKVFISVKDNGGGISAKNIKKIFDPYFTTKDKENGTGLGLYILRLIVEDSMHGKISVHNEKEGANFTIQIPFRS